MKHLLIAILCCASCSTDPAELAAICEKFGGDIDLPTKRTEDACMVKCPPPVGWITDWMWADNHGCGPHK